VDDDWFVGLTSFIPPDNSKIESLVGEGDRSLHSYLSSSLVPLGYWIMFPGIFVFIIEDVIDIIQESSTAVAIFAVVIPVIVILAMAQ